MNTFRTIGAVALVCAATTLSAEIDAGSATTTKDDCMTAWAVLSSGDSFGQELVKNVVRWNPQWSAEGYVPYVSQKFQLLTMDRVYGGGSVTVAHCGHGGTCNELARAVAKAYPNVGNPVVYCVIAPPYVLDNPQNI